MLKKCLAIVGLLSEGWRCNQSSDGGKEMEFHFHSSFTHLGVKKLSLDTGLWFEKFYILLFIICILSEKLISIYGSLIWNNGNPLKVDNWTNLKSCRLSFLWDITKTKQAFYPWLWLFYSGDCLFKATDLGSIYRATQDAIPFPHR